MKNERLKQTIDTSLASLRISERDVQSIMTQVREGKRVKKKLSAGLVLALLLLLLTVTAVGVGVMSGMKYWEAKEADIGSPLDLAVLDGNVYLTTEDGFFEWNPETEKTTELNGLGIQAVWSSLFVRDGQLMLLGEPGKLWRFENGDWVLERDYAGTPLAAYAGKKSNLIYWQDCVLMPEFNEAGSSQNLLKLNLLDGSAEVLYEGNVLRLCGYRDGKLLAVLIVDEETEKLVEMDAQTGEITQEITQMHLFAMKGLAYDEQNDCIYAMVDGTLSSWNGREWQSIRQATVPWLAHSFAVVGNLYLAASHEGIQGIELDAQQPQEQITLTISGLHPLGGNLDHDFQQAHAGVAVARRTENDLNALEIAEAIRNGDRTDLFYFRVDGCWPELLKSGLLEPIRSEKLLAQAGEMAEVFRRLAFEEETLRAVVSDVVVTAWTQQTDQVPVTILELLSQKYAGLTWEYRLWNQDDYISHLIKQQIREQGAAFDTPAFRETLQTLKQLGWDKRSQARFSTARAFSMGNLLESKGFAAPLRIDQDGPEHYPIELYLYVLNPNTQHKETALAFLEYAASQIDAETKAMLNPEKAQPVLLPFAEQWIEDVKVQHAQDVKDGLLPDDPAALEERIENLRNMPGHQLVTQEQIDFYKANIFPNLNFGLHPLLSDDSKELRTQMKEIIIRYLKDEITQDETIQKLMDIANTAVL